MESLKTKTLEKNATLAAMLNAFKKAQESNTFESLEINGTDLEHVQELSAAFEEFVVHGDPQG
jgi:hypothetical protein